SSRRRHTRSKRDWSSDVCSSDLGINALNGVFGAWTDSIPMVVISGQVKIETLVSSFNISGLRQLGDQEADIISMVRPITKYAVRSEERRVGKECRSRW